MFFLKKLQVMSTAEQSEGAYGSSVVTVENLKGIDY